jgi:hypothetical protein
LWFVLFYRDQTRLQIDSRVSNGTAPPSAGVGLGPKGRMGSLLWLFPAGFRQGLMGDDVEVLLHA